MTVRSGSDGFEPVFIGSFRSGTTLLVNLLGLHPELQPWFETKALCEPLRWLRVLRLPDQALVESELVKPRDVPGFNPEAVGRRMVRDFRETADRIQGLIPSGKAVGERYPLGHDVARYRVEEAVAEVQRWVDRVEADSSYVAIARVTGELISRLGALQIAGSGKARWINKTPEITRFGPELRDCLGPCKIIMMIRDGHQVVRSAEKLGWAKAAEIALWWKAMIMEARAGAELDPLRYFELRYESLVDNPAVELDRVLAFLGVEPCGERLVAEYLGTLGITHLTRAAAEHVPNDRVFNGSSADAGGLIDENFNHSLGY
jgi:hypothetical protein